MLTPCGFSEKLEVTIPAQATGEKVDVYFLADSTGSMGPSCRTATRTEGGSLVYAHDRTAVETAGMRPDRYLRLLAKKFAALPCRE